MPYVLDTTMCKQRQISKYMSRPTGNKDEPNIVCMRKSLRTSQHGTQNASRNKIG